MRLQFLQTVLDAPYSVLSTIPPAVIQRAFQIQYHYSGKRELHCTERKKIMKKISSFKSPRYPHKLDVIFWPSGGSLPNSVCVGGWGVQRGKVRCSCVHYKAKGQALDEGQTVPAKTMWSCQGYAYGLMGQGSMTHIVKVKVFLFFHYG